MSSEPSKSKMKASTRWSLLTLFAVVALLAPIAAWRLSCWFVAPQSYPTVHYGPPISMWDAESIALAEVKQREGWSGHADMQGGELNEWWVYVYRDFEHPKSDPDMRVVGVDMHDGHVTVYNTANAKQ